MTSGNFATLCHYPTQCQSATRVRELAAQLGLHRLCDARLTPTNTSPRHPRGLILDSDQAQADNVQGNQGKATEAYRYDDRVVGWFLLATGFWGIIATLATAATWWIFLSPDQIAVEYTFPRIAPIHIYLAVFAFAANAMFAGIYYSTQRLCKREMWSRTLSYLHFFGWQFVNVWAVATLVNGFSERRSGHELVPLVDLGVAIAMAFFTLNLVMTVAQRRQRHIYVSLWYYLASAIAVLPIHVICNLAIPTDGYGSTSLFWGVQDGFIQAWGSQVLLFYLLVMPGMGIMYYFVPKSCEQPVANYRLVILQFWGMMTFGILSSSRLLHFTAIPEWIQSLGMLTGVLLFLPSWVGVTNGTGMLLQASKAAWRSPILQLFFAAICFFAIACLESALTSIQSLSTWTLFTDWHLAHIYCITFGWAGLLGMGAAFWIVPQIGHRSIWNKGLLRIQAWISIASVAILVLSVYVSGFLQGSMSLSLDSTGTLVYPEFIEVVQRATAFWWIAFAGAAATCLAAFLFAANTSLTWVLRNRRFQQRTTLAPRLQPDYEDEPPPASSLEGEAILNLGIQIDRWRQFTFHRKWERSVSTFVVLIVAAVLVGLLLEFTPAVAFGNRLPEGVTKQPYSPLQLAGREIFVREGCANCHTQTVRPLVAETSRYGDYSQPQDFHYDRPALWGNRRVGPDLAREGGKQNGWWHWQHLTDPRTLNPESVMPSFAHLAETELDLGWVRELLRRESASGVSYEKDLLSDQELSEEDRRMGERTALESSLLSEAEIIAADIVTSGGPPAQFDSEMTAIIAYLQRLGVSPQ